MREDPLAFLTDEELDRLVEDARRVADILLEREEKRRPRRRRTHLHPNRHTPDHY